MAILMDKSSIVTRVSIRPETKEAFAEWQSKLQTCIASFDGFISLEILSPPPSGKQEWVIIQHFYNPEKLEKWLQSFQHKELFSNLTLFMIDQNPSAIKNEPLRFDNRGVTEVIVTRVKPEQSIAFRDWLGKIHQAESKFQGFQRVFVQSPDKEVEGGSWVTILQFDTLENLDTWINSKERRQLLEEGQGFVKSFETHRVHTPFSGWFKELSEVAPLWKQTMLILLVLFPIVMLEFKFLNPHLTGLNTSLATFIGNAISVSLVSWPMMPIAIHYLRWWLNPSQSNLKHVNLIGTLVVIGLYLIEIAIFWY